MFPSGPTVGPEITPWPADDGSVNVHRIEPFGAIAVIVCIEAAYTVPSEPIEGPPSAPTDGTVHLSPPSAVSEYTLPVELATTTPPSGPTAGGCETYWPLTSNRHLTVAWLAVCVAVSVLPAGAADTGAAVAMTVAPIKPTIDATPRRAR